MRLSIPKRKNHTKHFPTVCTSTLFSIFWNLKFKKPIPLHDKEHQLFFAIINTWPSKDPFLKMTLQERQIAVTSCPLFLIHKRKDSNFTLSRKYFFYLFQLQLFCWQFAAVWQNSRHVIQISILRNYFHSIYPPFLMEEKIEKNSSLRFSTSAYY